ncbi:MAG: hypothetical protein ABSF69_22515 [Polyangiaceae bacterium]
MLYVVSMGFHVLTAVLAVGLVGAIPLTARMARHSARDLAGVERILGALLLATRVGLTVMVLTGGLLDLSAAGAFHRTGWFQASIVVFVFLGVTVVRTNVALRRGFAPGGARDKALGQVERGGWAMCASVALIVLLMQMKPLP